MSDKYHDSPEASESSADSDNPYGEEDVCRRGQRRYRYARHEQNRSDKLREGFAALKERLPNLRGRKASQVEIRNEAKKYIQETEARLRKQNKELSNEIELLQQYISVPSGNSDNKQEPPSKKLKK